MSHSRFRCHHESRTLRTARISVVLLALVAIIATAAATPALAYWTSTGSASGSAATGTLTPATSVTASRTTARNVVVGWTAGVGGIAPTGYYVSRHTASPTVTTTPACASSPTTLIAGPACTDTLVPDGTFTYVVTAVFRSWTATSLASAQVIVLYATSVAFVVQPTNILMNSTITPPVTVALRTAADGAYATAGVPVTLTISGPTPGILTGTNTVNTDANGVATFNNLSVTQAGASYTLTATSPGLTSDVSAAFAVTAPFLGAAQSFSVLGVTAVVNTGTSTVSGDVGVSPAGTISEFSPGSIGGDIHLNDDTARDAQTARGIAYTDLSTRTATAQIVGDLGGRTLLPGVYHSTAALALTGTLILNGNGNPDAVFVFQSDAAFNTAADSVLILQGGAKAANVYWVAVGAAGTGATSALSGTIISAAAITLGAGMVLIGRALSAGTVTMASNVIRFTDAAPPTIAITGGATATTKNITPPIAGTSNAATGSPITVRVAGQTHTTTVGSGGIWSVTATVLAAGTYEVVARVRDAAGNGTAVSQMLTVEVNPASVDLATATTFALLATDVTSTGTTVITGDVGVSAAGVVTGLTPADVNGTIYVNDSTAAAARSDLDTVITQVAARTKHTEISGDLGGKTFHLGIHHQTAAMALTGTVTLDAENNPDAIFIFTTDAAFNTAASAKVVLANGAKAGNVYWVVTGAAGTGASSVLSGTILARGAITLGASTTLAGRALSLNPATLAGNTISLPAAPAAFGRQALDSGPDSGMSVLPDETTPAVTDETGAEESGTPASSTVPTSTPTSLPTTASTPAPTSPGQQPTSSPPSSTLATSSSTSVTTTTAPATGPEPSSTATSPTAATSTGTSPTTGTSPPAEVTAP